MGLELMYYPNSQNIALALGNYEFNDHYWEEDGFYHFALGTGKGIFKAFLPLPGIDPDDPDSLEPALDDDGDPLWLDSWNQAKLFDCPKLILTSKAYFAWYPWFADEEEDGPAAEAEVVAEFNEFFDKDFSTFGECWNWASSGDPDNEDDFGLELSANVLSEFEEY